MFKSIVILSLSTLLAGCGTLSSLYMAMPTVQNCEYINYTRVDKSVEVEMKCTNE